MFLHSLIHQHQKCLKQGQVQLFNFFFIFSFIFILSFYFFLSFIYFILKFHDFFIIQFIIILNKLKFLLLIQFYLILQILQNIHYYLPLHQNLHFHFIILKFIFFRTKTNIIGSGYLDFQLFYFNYHFAKN
jgi:hypothetical protein